MTVCGIIDKIRNEDNMNQTNETLNFSDLVVKDSIKQAIEEIGYLEMTPIQKEALPYVLKGIDVIAQAPTGTGKTCCYAIPAINLVDVENTDIQVMILCPTRELAMQVTTEIKKIAKFTKGLKAVTVYGGQDIERQIISLKKKPQIIVGTPGRIMDHMRRHTLKINNIKMLVLDEADEMLNMGFREDLDVILTDVTPDRQTVLFSATMPDGIKRITTEYQKNAVHVKTTINKTSLPNINQYYVELSEANKTDCLSRMIDTYNFKQALVFCRTKKKVDDLSFALTSRGYPVECIHGDMKQSGREKVMEMFRNGMVRVLIATDVAARGIDIDGIDAVFNYDITDDAEYYVHRIGRTARAGRTGCAYTFVTKRELNRIKEIVKYTNVPIEKIAPPTYEQSENNKVKNILNELIASMADVDLKPYLNRIYEALAEAGYPYEPEDIAAAFLKQLIDTDSRFKDAGLDLSSTKGKRSATPSDYSRIFINLGRKDELNKAELVDLACTNRLLERSQVTGIDILNTYSFFEIPSTKAQFVLEAINGTSYNGRVIDAEVSKTDKPRPARRSGDSDRSRRSGDSDRSRRSGDSDRSRRSGDSDRPRRSGDSDRPRRSDSDRPRREIKPTAPKEDNAVVRGTKEKFKTEHSRKKVTIDDFNETASRRKAASEEREQVPSSSGRRSSARSGLDKSRSEYTGRRNSDKSTRKTVEGTPKTRSRSPKAEINDKAVKKSATRVESTTPPKAKKKALEIKW